MATPIIPTFDYLTIDADPNGARIYYIVKESDINYRNLITGNSDLEKLLLASCEEILKEIYGYYDATVAGGNTIKKEREPNRKIVSILFESDKCTIYFTRKGRLSPVSTKLRTKDQPFKDLLYSTIDPSGRLKSDIVNDIFITVDALSKIVTPSPRQL